MKVLPGTEERHAINFAYRYIYGDITEWTRNRTRVLFSRSGDIKSQGLDSGFCVQQMGTLDVSNCGCL
ncbi:hypothetical protein VN97_g6535 [Penicillium thymicola]|uniref:Uncharacterized protein n=1 Tax=Penicillium thymicola TaxID=293382 RepID=A0AAI9TG70_PENTH|nr:hypothetical protein VN97_g6535 [Penicillium thymicola]